MRTLISVIAAILLLSMLVSLCSPANGNFPGHEYMPDMYHAVGYEANVITDYKWNHWDEESIFTKKELSQPRKPVNGSVARGMTAAYYGRASDNGVPTPNGSVAYYYGNNDDERARATAEIISNPYAPTAKELQLMEKAAQLEAEIQSGIDRSAELTATQAAIDEEAKAALAVGKNLYDIQCAICHGEKGDGAGYLTRDGSAYQAAPANFLSDEFKAASDGRYYHAIMYGKGVMGSYADKSSYEERWKMIRYIRSLQTK